MGELRSIIVAFFNFLQMLPQIHLESERRKNFCALLITTFVTFNSCYLRFKNFPQ